MKKILLVFFSGIFALAAMGFGFAGWSDAVSMEKHLESGTLAVGLRGLEVNDYGPDPRHQWYHPAEDMPAYMGSIFNVEGPYLFDLGGTGYAEEVSINIFNAYPGYAPASTLEIANGGTVPAKIESLSISDENNPAVNIQPAGWVLTLPEGMPLSGQDLSSLQEAIKGTVIDPGQKMRLEWQFNIFGAGMSGFYTSKIKVNYSVWNEVNSWRKLSYD
jgi:hypothetical protein